MSQPARSCEHDRPTARSRLRKQEEKGTMDTSHANALLQKHAVLDSHIQAEMSRPIPDDVMNPQLKKHKLRLKEELARHLSLHRATPMNLPDCVRLFSSHHNSASAPSLTHARVLPST